MLSDDKILLILDLDETLIHSVEEEPETGTWFRLFQYYVVKRPFLEYFLTECSNHFRLAVWSSATDDYTAMVVKEIFSSAVKPEFVWGRSKTTFRPVANRDDLTCTGFSHYDFIKRLRKIKTLGYQLEKTLIVDDTPHKVKENYGNAIYVSEFLGDQDDHELPLLLDYLLTLKDCQNVLSIEKRNWRKR